MPDCCLVGTSSRDYAESLPRSVIDSDLAVGGVMYVGGRRAAGRRQSARGRVVDLSASQPSRETDAYRLIAWNVTAASPAGFTPHFHIPFPSKTHSNTAAEGYVSVFGRFYWTGLGGNTDTSRLSISIVYFVMSTYEGDLATRAPAAWPLSTLSDVNLSRQ